MDLHSHWTVFEQPKIGRLPRRERANAVIRSSPTIGGSFRSRQQSLRRDVFFGKTHFKVPVLPSNVHEKLWNPSLRISMKVWLPIVSTKLSIASVSLALSFET